MGCGGVGSMNVILKNNRNLLPKRDRFKNSIGCYSKRKTCKFNFPEAKPHVLREIRDRLQSERQQKLKLLLIIYFGLLGVIITGLLYFFWVLEINYFSLKIF